MIKKVLAFFMIIFSIVIILEQLEIFELNFFINVVTVGAISIIIFQAINLFLSKIHNGAITIVQWITALIFVTPALIYFLPFSIEKLELIIGVVMLAESLYALH